MAEEVVYALGVENGQFWFSFFFFFFFWIGGGCGGGVTCNTNRGLRVKLLAIQLRTADVLSFELMLEEQGLKIVVFSVLDRSGLYDCYTSQ